MEEGERRRGSVWSLSVFSLGIFRPFLGLFHGFLSRNLPVILGDLYSPIISWDFLFSSSPVSAHDDVSGSKVVSRGCVVTFWTSNGADKVDFCHLKSP